MLVSRAPAKVNLTLAVHGRRADGHHDLTSLVAFAGVGDELSLTPASADSLACAGPFGAALGGEPDNLVLKATRLLRERRPGLKGGAFHLVKRLPLASGVGGGSADAAAALRLLARLNGLAADDPVLMDAARETGADVPVCLRSRACVMSGTGEVLGPPLRLPRLFAVLANPGVPAPTGAVFAALGLAQGQALTAARAMDGWSDMPAEAEQLVDALTAGRGNDLEPAAVTVAPAIARTLEALRCSPGCLLARMSGSGATCFGLFADCRASAAAARLIARAEPGWWVKATVLR